MSIHDFCPEVNFDITAGIISSYVLPYLSSPLLYLGWANHQEKMKSIYSYVWDWKSQDCKDYHSMLPFPKKRFIIFSKSRIWKRKDGPFGKLFIVLTRLCYSKRIKQPQGAVHNVFWRLIIGIRLSILSLIKEGFWCLCLITFVFI